MNLFTISAILVFVSNTFLALFVFIKCHDKKLSIKWVFFAMMAAIWGFGGYKASSTLSKEAAFLWWQFSYIGIIFVPVAYFHFVYCFLELRNKPLLISFYAFGIFFVVLNFLSRNLFLADLRFTFNQFFWNDWLERKPFLYLIFYISFYWFLLSYAFFSLIKSYKDAKALKRNQLKYFILASFIGWLGAECMFLPVFHIDLYPSPNFLIAIYPFIMSYAIIRHHLLDINIVIRKGLVYSILVAIITIIYLILVLLSERFLQNLVGYRSLITSISFALIIALLFNPLRDRIHRFLDKRFFKGTLESLSEEKERLKQELFQAEKLAYVGGLASSIAHEIKNPLTVLKTFIEYLPEKANEPEFKERMQQLLPQEIKRIENVVHQLLDLAKPRLPSFKQINITNTIDTTLSLLENNLKLKKIEVKKDYAASEIMIQGDDEQLRQVFLNLFLNSIQAMNNGGLLEVSINLCSSDSKSPPAGQAGVIICVIDNGVGISEENLNKLFTPFFTTKKDGVGLGLSITKEIVKQHNGSIKVESELRRGTRFIIELPLQ